MNKLAIALSAALAIGASFSASAQSGTITFNGQITATTCDITWPGSGGTAKDPIVTLPTMPTTALASAGSTAGKQTVSLLIGGSAAQCTSGNAAIELNPNRDANQSNGYLNNAATVDAATEVQIALRDATDAPIDISTPWRSAEIDLATTKQIDFAAEYRATGAATAGNVNASVGYTIDYK
ncbi:type 1 fimbrial protein [Stenotrophomonas sp. Sa5BUN4]|uniref:Type 1 fimbrial protein n=1 Tax=Stenotrophomonas lacuserhaii TaxID=2760084 RepID=A0A8X8FRC7_9GAMM|nr:fimbrial protein [Stenotrophomonas pennii]MBD7953475.1 type 1 fimbrial protein [Stenotrophomonas pennii]